MFAAPMMMPALMIGRAAIYSGRSAIFPREE
jgi:hypothetical protein